MMDSDIGVNVQNQGSIVNEPTMAGTQVNPSTANGERETQSVSKRPIKLTHKALMHKLDKLQKVRKAKLNKASDLKRTIQDLMHDREYKTEVQCTFDRYTTLCNEAKEQHQSLSEILSHEEKDKPEIWFKAKMLSVNDFTDAVNKWLSNADISKPDENDDAVESEVKPSDSISNVETKVSIDKLSRKSHTSSRTSKSSSSVRIQIEAERAALETRAAALKEKHELEEQSELLRKKKEKLEVDTEMAAVAAKLAVFKASGHQAFSNTQSDGMESYFEKGARLKEVSTTLNGHAKAYQPTSVDLQQQPPIQQQQQQYAYRNATHDNSTVCQLNPENTSRKPRMDHPHVQLTNPGLIQSQLAHKGNDETSALCNLLQRQNEITTLLIQQQASHSLPPREIPFFDGDPLQ